MPHPISYKELQNLVCTSAHQYYDYLTEKFNQGNLSSGAKVITVYRITSGRIPGEYVLTTSEKVAFPDACQIWVRGEYFPSIEILTVCSQGKGTHSISISDRKGHLAQFPALSPQDIQIISDLRFLIRRLSDFYESQNFSFLPSAPSDTPPLPETLIQGLSDEQIHAIDTIFHAPVSYVSGAPGTGKTKAVLSRCILRYIFAKKRIVLLAPTNNAVEQMLRGVLPILQDAGIDLECVYRLGTATDEFAKEYPQVVGDKSLESLLQGLLNRKAFCESQLQAAYNLRQKAESAAAWVNDCKIVHQKVSNLFEQVSNLDGQLLSASNTHDDAKRTMNAAKDDWDNATIRADTAHQHIIEHDKQVFSIRQQIKKSRSWFWMKKQRALLEAELSGLLSRSAQLHAAHAESIVEHDQCRDKWLAAKTNYENSLTLCQNIAARRTSLLRKIADAASFDVGYTNAINPQIAIPANAVAAGEAYLRSLEAKLQNAAELAAASPCDVYQSELAEIKQQLNNLGSSAKALQRAKALVLAGTIDSSLKMLSTSLEEDVQNSEEDHKIHHVFLDEAGYTCLAKGMVAFACGAPVTFLGDHKQLPPVCEMSSIPQSAAPVCLWALSIAYYPELVYDDFANLYHNCYKRSVEPSFNSVEYCTLNTSYRFGPALADILRRYIYSNNFCGMATAPFTIHVVNAPHHPGPVKNSSRSEADAILSWLYATPCDDIAILTPYRGQHKHLRDTLPRMFRDNILTVHRSQGCEWDTVVLSVVDTYRPYFTDSNLPIGRSVLNTAISRAKRRLVIVCDVAEWSKRPYQLVTELIRCSKPIPQ